MNPLEQWYQIALENNNQLKQANANLITKISNQNVQLDRLQKAGRDRNLEMAQMAEQIRQLVHDKQQLEDTIKNSDSIRLKQELEEERRNSAQLREQLGREVSGLRQANNILKQKMMVLENNNYTLLSHKKRTEQDKQNLLETHRKEVQQLEKSMEEERNSFQHDLQKKMNYQELLKEKADETDETIEKLQSENRELRKQIEKPASDGRRLEQELSSLRLQAVPELTDKTCLICHSDMDTFPKCSKCRRHYHGECLYKWFTQERKVCPQCEEAASSFENMNAPL